MQIVHENELRLGSGCPSPSFTQSPLSLGHHLLTLFIYISIYLSI